MKNATVIKNSKSTLDQFSCLFLFTGARTVFGCFSGGGSGAFFAFFRKFFYAGPDSIVIRQQDFNFFSDGMCCSCCLFPRFQKVLDAGADSIAVISAITKANDVAEAVRKWSGLFKAENSEGS